MNWTSCEERMPEKNGKYLAWLIYHEDDGDYALINFDVGSGAFGDWVESLTQGNRVFCKLHKVVAWCELPKPYTDEALKGGEE